MLFHTFACWFTMGMLGSGANYFTKEWKIKMQASVHKARNDDGRRELPDRRFENLRNLSERRDEIARRDEIVGVMEPEDRTNAERRSDQPRRCENRRQDIRRSERERRDD